MTHRSFHRLVGAAMAAALCFACFGPVRSVGQDTLSVAPKASTPETAVDASAARPEVGYQGMTGMAVYEETVKFDFDLPPQMQRFRDRLEDTRNSAIVVIFNESKSLSQLAPEPEQPEVEAEPRPVGRRNRRFRIFDDRENRATFVDFENEAVVDRREFLDRTFLVDGGEKPVWKLTGDVSEFLGYQSHRATAVVDDTMLVEAWFTPEIPVPAGPDGYYGLPGLILVLTTNEGNHSYVAREVSLRPVSDDLLVAPTEGKQVTREEFRELVREKREEMRQQRQQRGDGRFIRRRGG